MRDPPPSRRPDSNELLFEIVETLETQGLKPDQYQLAEILDIEALDSVVSNSDSSVEVRATVKGFRLQITGKDVRVLETPKTPPSDET